MILDLSDFETKESLRTKVSLEALKGTCVSEPFFRASKARMHSFSASKLLFISAPSALRFLSFDWVSCALSEPYFYLFSVFIFLHCFELFCFFSFFSSFIIWYGLSFGVCFLIIFIFFVIKFFFWQVRIIKMQFKNKD